MYVLANNLTTRESTVNAIFRSAERTGWTENEQAGSWLEQYALQCASAGPDALEVDVQQHHGQPEVMAFIVNAIQQVTDLRRCLSTNNPKAIEAGVLLLVSDPTSPSDAREMLQKASVLVGASLETGIAGDDILVDPGLIHVTSDIGQRHLVEVTEFLRSLPEAIDPPVRSTCWLSNSSAGAREQLRFAIESALLPMLAGAGLSSVFLDVLRPANRKALRLIKIFENRLVYSDSEIE